MGYACLILTVLLTAVVARPQDLDVPMNIQLPLLLKVLSADRNLRERAGAELMIGVIYQQRYRASVNTMEAILEVGGQSALSPFPDQPLRLVAIPVDNAGVIDSLLAAHEVDVCYLAPLRATGLAPILSATRARRIVTCTGVPEYIESGVAIGFDAKGGKPQIVINIEAAKAEGIDFSSQLLKLARIIADG